MKNETEAIITYKTKVYKLTTTDGYTFEDLFSTLDDVLVLVHSYNWKHYGIIKIDTSCIQEKSNTIKAILKANACLPISGIEFDCKVVVDNYSYDSFTITTTKELALDIPISKYLKASKNELEIQLSLKDLHEDESPFDSFSLETEYIEETSKKHITQTAQLVGGAEEIVDLFTGDSVTRIVDTADENIGIEISHILKRSEDDFCCGEDARLNIHEKLVKNEDIDLSAEYIYTDELGNKHYLKETFYYIDSNGTKQDITDKTTITVLPNGKLEYIDPETSTHFEVYRKEATFCGLKAVTNLDNVKNIKYFEQRQQELKELEQQTDAYHKTLLDYVLVNGTDEELSFDNLEEFVSNVDIPGNKCYTKAEKLNLDSLSNQIAIVLKQENFNNELKEKYKNQSDDIGAQLESIDEQIANLENKKEMNLQSILYFQRISRTNAENNIQEDETGASFGVDPHRNYNAEMIKSYVLVIDEDTLVNFEVDDEDDKKAHARIKTDGDSYYNLWNNSALGFFKEYSASYFIMTKDEAITYKILKEQKASLQNSKSLIELQREAITKDSKYETLNIQLSALEQQRLHIESSNEHNKENVASIYKDYLILLNNLNITKKQIPVNYIVSDEYTKGFNENGDLVVIYDKHNKYAALEYKEYYSGTNKLSRISRIFNEKEQFIQFVYDHNNLLVKIIDSMGRITSFEYSSSSPFIINKIIYPNEEFIALTQWSEYKKTISTKYENSVIASSLFNGVTSITNSSTIEKVAHNDITIGEEKQISKITFSYDYKKTTVLDDMQSGVMYSFDDCLNIVKAIKFDRGLIVDARKYSYTDNLCTMEVFPTSSCLFVVNEEFIFAEDYNIRYEYDNFDKITKSTYSVRAISDSLSVITSTEYFYDNNNRLFKTKTTYLKNFGDTSWNLDENESAITLFEYNSNGLISKKQSYIVGEETANGINVEEYVYNDNGFLTATITYNSLDPSSKYYSEQEIDENGQIIADIDACGMNKTSYNGNTIVYPNGGKFSYGYDSKNGNSAITQSTKDGEENSIQRQYTNGLLTRVINGDQTFDYEYDHKSRIKRILINGVIHVVYNYTTSESNLLEKITANYRNGLVETFETNELRTQHSISYNGESKLVVTDKNRTGKIDAIFLAENNATQSFLEYSYNNQNKVRTINKYDSSGNTTYQEKYSYTEDGKLDTKIHFIDSAIFKAYEHHYSDDYEKALKETLVYELDNGSLVCPVKFSYSTDNLKRNIERTIFYNDSKIFSNKLSYLKQSDHTTNMVCKLEYGRMSSGSLVFNENFKYKYDDMGNICEIRENGKIYASYEYDDLNRLIRENNKALGKTYFFRYDNKGNILEKIECSYTTEDFDDLPTESLTSIKYQYANGILTRFGNKSITNAFPIGKPTRYKNITLEWTLNKLTNFGGTCPFVYDSEGKRLSKKGISFTYDANGNLIKQSNGIDFIYDNSKMAGFSYNGIHYFYKKDILGNVIEILDSTGATVVKYIYDAWGNHKVLNADGTENTDATFVGNINPIRYRSYYYDTETGLYYLQSRYYDPEVGRFISMDDINYLDPETIGGTNLYAYCLNNPVMFTDPTGHSAILTFLAIVGISALIGATSGAIMSGITYAITTESFIERDFWASVTGGAISGGIMGAFSGILIITGGTAGAVVGLSAVVGALSNIVGSVVEGAINGKLQANTPKYLLGKVLPSAAWGAIFGTLGGAMSGAIKPASIMAKELGRTLGKQLIKILQYQVIKKIVPNLVENLLSDFTSWYTEFVLENTFYKIFE